MFIPKIGFGVFRFQLQFFLRLLLNDLKIIQLGLGVGIVVPELNFQLSQLPQLLLVKPTVIVSGLNFFNLQNALVYISEKREIIYIEELLT